eukprot:SAG22_NODE_21766_length_254_cov_0.670968_1_plen_71_part_01
MDVLRDSGFARVTQQVCIGNLDRLGRTEVELVNLVIYGAARLVQIVSAATMLPTTSKRTAIGKSLNCIDLS